LLAAQKINEMSERSLIPPAGPNMPSTMSQIPYRVVSADAAHSATRPFKPTAKPGRDPYLLLH
jgi:hypothetical protein